MSDQPQPPPPSTSVTIKIDGKEIVVPKGMNVIEAAKRAGVDIPHYCYHQNLSIAGNCRMCQVEVKGQPKLTIACNTTVAEGMEVSTHLSSKAVADAQAATLEFILINHPLDCTICDQAGHCKLQDYHFEYNARSSRFLEDKEHKVKALPLGPNVMLDGERCIMCTRCIRFCDEVTGTSELGMLHRGDRSVIAVSPGRDLDNALSGSVVDLCPVGALTHRHWRFNTRIWFTKQTDSICPGCSTGCNVKIATRDGEVVNVKARNNQSVNQEWLCDEGRYGFDRFIPQSRVVESSVRGTKTELRDAIALVGREFGGSGVIFLSPDLLVEDYLSILKFTESLTEKPKIVVQYQERSLSSVEKILVSPDYAANFKGAMIANLVEGDLEKEYRAALIGVENRDFRSIVMIGDRSVPSDGCTPTFLAAVRAATFSGAVLTDANHPLVSAVQVVIPGRGILEKSGLLINRAGRVQYAERVLEFPVGSEPEWRIFQVMCEAKGSSGFFERGTASDRDATRDALRKVKAFEGMSISALKPLGLPGTISTETRIEA